MKAGREERGGPSVILLAVGDGYQARVLLRSAVFQVLKANVDQLVVLAPNPGEPYLQEELAAPNVVLEDLQVDGATANMGRNRVQTVLRGVRNFALQIGRARALNDKAGWRMPSPSRRWWVRWATRAMIWACQRSGLVRRGLVTGEHLLMPKGFYGALFKKYRPGLVVTGLPGYLPYDTLLLREAKARRIPTACVTVMWDSPHNMGLAGARPDRVVVWSHVQKGEMERYQGFSPQSLVVGGVPHFDIYKSRVRWPSRGDVLSKYGLDPARKLIVFATKSPSVYLHTKVVEALVRAIEEGRFTYPAQLLVRLHPQHFATLMAGSPFLKGIMDEYQALRAGTPYLSFSVPRIQSERMDTDMPASEMEELATLLRHTDVLVNLFSTIQLEACLAGVPVINLAFDPPRGSLPDGTTLLPSQAREGYRLRPIVVDMGQPQGRRVIASGATRQASSLEELIQLINAYLENPRLDAEARQRLVEQECGPTDGHAGERIGQFLLGLLQERRAMAQALLEG